MTNLAAAPTTRQIGIRQRSLRRHCRMGRATELVFVLATGVTLALSGGAEAQTWDGSIDGNFLTGTNWAGDAAPTAADNFVLDDATIPDQPTLGVGDAATAQSGAVSAGTLIIDGDLTTTTGLTVTGTGTVFVGMFGSITGTLLGGGGTVTNEGTIDAVT